MGAHSKPREPRAALRSLLEWALIVIVVVAAIQLVRVFVVEPYYVPTASMSSTIEPGDSLFVEKVSLRLGEGVERGDIVVFRNPDATSDHEVLVKRVVATGGETVSLVVGEDGAMHVAVDGEVLDEPYATGSTAPLAGGVSFPYRVPEGSVWLMGDNRENSADSRMFGAVREDALIGKAVFRYWPIDRIGPLS